MSESNSDKILISVSMYLNTLFSIVAADYNITIFPTAILHESGINGYKIYQKSDLKVETNVTKSAERVKQWIFERLEENDRIVVKAITAEAFKSSPDDFKHVSQKYSSLRCLLHVKGLVICFYLGWSGRLHIPRPTVSCLVTKPTILILFPRNFPKN